jgi:hypothetical protein
METYMECAGLPALCLPKLALASCGAISALESGGKPPHSKSLFPKRRENGIYGFRSLENTEAK